MEKELNIEVSSTSLGFDGDGGTTGAFAAFAEGLISKDLYTQIVIENAQEFEKVTKENIPEATFGVSVLASSVNPKMMKNMISSIDYPYYIKWNRDFLKGKIGKDITVDDEGIKGMMVLAQDLAYAMLQAGSSKEQESSTFKAAGYVVDNPIKIRTCIETISIEDELKKIKKINKEILRKDLDVIWAIEPNMKIGDGTLSSFLNTLENIQKDNPTLSFGIDLDIGGLVKEDKNLLQILDTLDVNRKLPIYISLSGKEDQKDTVRTHLPLVNDEAGNIELGRWLHNMKFRGKGIPRLIIETNPTQSNMLKDYEGFLKNLRTYY